MYHSITFGEMNTWDDWQLVPTSRPVFNPPPQKTYTVDIPGAHGTLDLSYVLTGKPLFENRTGSLEFLVVNAYNHKELQADSYREWYDAYSVIANYLHGQTMTAVLEDEPDCYYEGRFTVNSWKSDKNYSTITIDYDLYPFKKKSESVTAYKEIYEELETTYTTSGYSAGNKNSTNGVSGAAIYYSPYDEERTDDIYPIYVFDDDSDINSSDVRIAINIDSEFTAKNWFNQSVPTYLHISYSTASKLRGSEFNVTEKCTESELLSLGYPLQVNKYIAFRTYGYVSFSIKHSVLRYYDLTGVTTNTIGSGGKLLYGAASETSGKICPSYPSKEQDGLIASKEVTNTGKYKIIYENSGSETAVPTITLTKTIGNDFPGTVKVALNSTAIWYELSAGNNDMTDKLLMNIGENTFYFDVSDGAVWVMTAFKKVSWSL